MEMLAERSGGDARVALSGLERAVERAQGKTIDVAAIEDAMQRKALDYDRQGDRHYDFVSAWIKATRGSDVDASLYYLAVMLEGGEDPRFIARRMVILASEDIGNADPQALLVADAAARAVDRVGLPECALNLAQATVHLALAPKSNASYKALAAARAEVRANGAKTPPDYLRDAHYPGAEKLGRGSGYRYAHDEPGGVSDQQLLPEGLAGPPLLRADRPRLRGRAGPPAGRAAQAASPGHKRSRNFSGTPVFQWSAFQARARESRHTTGRRPGLGASGRNLHRGERALRRDFLGALRVSEGLAAPWRRAQSRSGRWPLEEEQRGDRRDHRPDPAAIRPPGWRFLPGSSSPDRGSRRRRRRSLSKPSSSRSTGK